VGQPAPGAALSYDLDGNILYDGRWNYTWDGENRLLKMQSLQWTQPAAPAFLPKTTLAATILIFRYDGLSRRLSKRTITILNGVATDAMEGYLYDGWNTVMITKLDPLSASETSLGRRWSCVWRPDVGSSLYARSGWQNAGGVGGLAWLQTGAAQNLYTSIHGYMGDILNGTAEIHVPMADHLGNIRHYVQFKSGTGNVGYGNYTTMTAALSANFEYDAFGREVRANGTAVPAANTPPTLTVGTPFADALPFHFSSKFTDPESGLNYYGYRYYDPRDGRWLGRDPNEERGGENLYGICFNDTLNLLDVAGRNPLSAVGGAISRILGGRRLFNDGCHLGDTLTGERTISCSAKCEYSDREECDRQGVTGKAKIAGKVRVTANFVCVAGSLPTTTVWKYVSHTNIEDPAQVCDCAKGLGDPKWKTTNLETGGNPSY
jgi:RHS repeat-associated protein